VHVPEIDREHRIWFATVDRLHQAMLAGKGKDLLKPLLAEANQYTLVHFAREEKLMADIHYPGIPDHAQQHAALTVKVQEFAGRYERGETTLTIELTLFLSEWIKRHVMTIDIRLGEYIRATAAAAGQAPLLLAPLLE
jgi:hemerythrin